MQLGCLVVLGALYMMWMGGQGLYTSIKNRAPMEIACENYDDVKPNKEWLKLTGCTLNVLESSYMEEGGEVTELYIPARGAGEDEGDPLYVLVGKLWTILVPVGSIAFRMSLLSGAWAAGANPTTSR